MAKRSVKLGQAIEWSEDEIDELTQISPADIEAARAWWRDNAPPGFVGLLEAVLDLEQGQLTDDGTV